MMRMLTILLVLVFSVGVTVKAQSGQTIKFEEIGLSFKVPNGWTGGVKEDFYLLGHKSIPGLLILTQNKSTSATELKNLAMQGIIDEGINLSPKGDFTLRGNDYVEGFYEGTFQGGNVRVFSIGLINKMGSGMNIFIVTEKAKFSDTHIQAVKTLAKSVKFFQQRDSKETSFWKNRIVGKRLKYLKVSTNNNQYDGSLSGISDSVSITLYNDGTFSYYSSSMASQSGSYGSGVFANRDKNRGEFKIYTTEGKTYLELYFPNKTRSYKLIVNEKRHTLLNGSRYSVLPIE